MELKVNTEIVLKEIELSDAEDIFNTINTQREYLGKWLPFVEITNQVEDTEGFINSLLEVPEDSKEFVFVIRYGGDFAGLVGFRDTDRMNCKTEIGYWLSESFQKKGIVGLSTKRLIEFAFEDLGMNRIQIRCAVENLPSKKIPLKLGFTHEGVERDGELLSGNIYTDLEVYSLLKREYSANGSEI